MAVKAAARICRMCNRATTRPDGYCLQHAVEHEQQRGNSAERGYDHKWREFRQYFLQCHPLCQDCLQRGETTIATEVHHKIKIKHAPAQRLVEANCRALCDRCHNRRTLRGE